MSGFPLPVARETSLRPFAPQRAVIGCGRDALHMCKVTNAEMLMTYWPHIREGLLRIQQKNPPRAHWLPEHVLMELHKGLAGQNAMECFLAHDGITELSHGFIVVYPLIDPFVSLPLKLFVWMLALEPQTMLQLVPELDHMVRARGFRGWQMQTSRKGWIRRCRDVGANVVEYVVAKDL